MLSPKELHVRAALFCAIRGFFSNHHFLEVDTPVRQPVIIPESNIQAIGSVDYFLQTSPEICMKRLLACGCRKIFQICSCFRREERGKHHLEEFTMLEWYRCDANYFQLMADCEGLLCHCMKELHRQFPELCSVSSDAKLLGNSCNLTPAWPRITVADAFAKWSPKSVSEALFLDEFDEILVEYIEPNLGHDAPTFLYDYPVALASLARQKRDDKSIAERFELYVNGIELANGFSELTDAVEQRRRFEIDLDLIEKKFNERMQIPEKFLHDLEQIGDAAGIAMGVDRLFMIILGKEEIGGAVAFAPEDL